MRSYRLRAVRTRVMALVVVLPLTLAACSGSSDLDDLAETLEKVAGFTPEQATCVADELRATGSYDEGVINDLADGVVDESHDDRYPTQADKDELLGQFDNDVATAVSGCGVSG